MKMMLGSDSSSVIAVICLLVSLQLVGEVSCAENIVMKFTYGDKDEMGPSSWKRTKVLPHPVQMGRSLDAAASAAVSKVSKEAKAYEKNHCKSYWMSPINIHTKNVNAPDLGKVASDVANEVRRLGTGNSHAITIVISVSGLNIAEETWEFGHADAYHGIEIRSTNFGVLHIMDNFDPLNKEDPYATFDFRFLTVFYCDLQNANPRRTMHQIDGKRSPVELHFTFWRPIDSFTNRNSYSVNQDLSKNKDNRESFIDEEASPMTEYSEDGHITVVIVVQGEVGPEENKYFEPVAQAARSFRGRNFGVDTIDETAVVKIKLPWSVTWLLPDNSAYYYYDGGSFPVPPCWKVGRYYILREKLMISQSQMDALTNIHTVREKSMNYRMPCTYSLLQNEILSTEVTINLVEFEFKGDDRKPRTADEIKLWKARKRKMRDFQNRLAGKAVSLLNPNQQPKDQEEEEQQNGATSNGTRLLSIPPFVIILILLHTVNDNQ